jgi:hypothetical protein
MVHSPSRSGPVADCAGLPVGHGVVTAVRAPGANRTVSARTREHRQPRFCGELARLAAPVEVPGDGVVEALDHAFVMAPGLTMQHGNPLLSTADGEFVLKNLVLITAALVLASRRPCAREAG